MRKNIMKATTLLLAAAMTMSLFVGCGKEEPKTESIVEDSKTQEDASNNVKPEATENNKDASKEEDSQEVNPFLGPNGLMFASEDDVEILVDGKPIKLKMTREDKYKLIELLEEYRNERISELAKDYNLTEREIRAKLCREPEEVYEMDDGDRFLEGIDIVLSVLD